MGDNVLTGIELQNVIYQFNINKINLSNSVADCVKEVDMNLFFQDKDIQLKDIIFNENYCTETDKLKIIEILNYIKKEILK